MKNTLVNCDETGIRYGCIYLNSLDSDLANDLWMNAENLSEAEAYAELKSEIERDAENIEEEVRIAVAERDYAMLSNDSYMEDEVEAAYNRLGYDDRDDYIDTRLELESERIQIEEPTLAGICEGVRYEISCLGGAPILFCTHSPFTITARLCSPCVPGAIDIDSPDHDGYEGYCPPVDWFPEENRDEISGYIRAKV